MNKEDYPVLAGIAVFYAVLQLLGITCPIKFLTGVSCAGCGMTRAWLAALRLDFSSAFSYHPLFLLAIPIALLLLFRKRLSRIQIRAGWSIIIAAMLICYIIRMADPSDTIVVFAPDQGIIGRGIGWISQFLCE